MRDTDDAVEYRLRAQEAYVETVADIYMQLGVRGFTLMMLTTDKAILNPAQKIQALIDEDRHDFGVLVRANESKRPNELVSERGATMLERHESRWSDLGDHIEELTKYCVTTFPIRDDKSKPVAGQ